MTLSNLYRFMTVLLCSTLPFNAHGHLLKVFAYSQSGPTPQTMTTSGKVYFAGGAPVADLKLDILNQQGDIVQSTISDPQGKFKVTLDSADYELIANTQDGHLAKWDIKAPVVSAITTSAQLDTQQTNQTATKDGLLGQQQGRISQDQLQQIFAQQLAIQIQPLTEQINALEERTKLQDIMGALGYIFGLYAMAMWWRQRKAPQKS